MDEVEQDTSGFSPIYAVAQGCGMLVVILTGVWMGHYRGGFGWSADNVFNWHPLLMVLSLVYLYGNGVLVYRLFRHERKKKLKLTHAAVMGVALVLAVVGLKAVFDSHNWADPPVPNLYSLHSWLGLITVILFSLQWLGGLVTFLFPGLASHLRALFLPVHVFMGTTIFSLACVTALLGITEKTLFTLKNYKDKPAEGILINWLGLLVVIFAILVIYLVQNARFKRLTRPEDEMLLQETANE